jgi:regulator of sirC expression with transglutaminase-like and TPR domain
MQLSLARQRFMQEVRQPDEYIDLERAALYIAQETYPDLDVDAYIALLDGMAEAVRARLPEEEYPLRTIKVLNQYFFDELGFRGNQADYYDTKNSLLNDVIDRRVGIPITLSLIYLAIARRIAFPMQGVGLPGHFLITPVAAGTEFFVDAFNQGEILFQQDCVDRLNLMFEGQLVMQPTFLAPVTNQQFLARMLTNLKAIYLSQGDIGALLSTIERILILFPAAPIELRDRGLIYFRLSRWIESRLDLEQYLTAQPAARDRYMIEGVLDQIEQSVA